VATYLRTLRAALGWACDEAELIKSAPKIRARRKLKRKRGMRSRPITGEEFDRILKAVSEIRPRDAAAWLDFIKGLPMSSLRIDELRRLSWDEGAELSIDQTGRYPVIKMLAEGHKAGEDCYQPITPEFWALISRPGRLRTGHVFPLAGRGQQMTRKAVIRVVSAIGAKAGVITEPTTGKTATSHDIGRRAALTKLSETLSMSQTQQMARHADPRTTSQYYLRHDAEKLAEAIGWQRVANRAQPAVSRERQTTTE
jgi:integrase